MASDRVKIFEMTTEREKLLWEEALLVFDTSAIGELYSCVESSKKTILEILNKLRNRIWVPEHVLYEYIKNRDKVIFNPITESYKKPLGIDYKIIENIETFLKSNKIDYFHPYVGEEEFQDIENKKNEIKERLDQIQSTIKQQYRKRKEDLQKVKENDIIYNAFMNFSVGEPSHTSQIMKIVSEGEIRYRNQIPPGYLDWKSKEGTQIYGDLIIWKEILKHAKEVGKSVIFIINDIKDDWYLKDEKGVPNSPRHELLREFYDNTGNVFWMYTLKQFIEKSEIHFRNEEILPLYSGLENVKYGLEIREDNRIRKLNRNESLNIKCGTCSKEFFIHKDELNFDWEVVEGSDRQMGSEITYNSYEYCECPHCDSSIEITLELWEYPEGMVNHTDLEIDGGRLLSKFDFSDEIELHNSEHSACARCGGCCLPNNEFCTNCQWEVEEKMKDN